MGWVSQIHWSPLLPPGQRRGRPDHLQLCLPWASTHPESQRAEAPTATNPIQAGCLGKEAGQAGQSLVPRGGPQEIETSSGWVGEPRSRSPLNSHKRHLQEGDQPRPQEPRTLPPAPRGEDEGTDVTQASGASHSQKYFRNEVFNYNFLKSARPDTTRTRTQEESKRKKQTKESNPNLRRSGEKTGNRESGGGTQPLCFQLAYCGDALGTRAGDNEQNVAGGKGAGRVASKVCLTNAVICFHKSNLSHFRSQGKSLG